MRKLTARQKQLLKAEFDRLVKSGIEYPDYFDMDYDTCLTIDNINPCEVYSQNVDRFFSDLIDKRLEEKEKDDWF